jgi:transposase
MGEYSAETEPDRADKLCRRVATRYDKLAANYLAFIQLASIRLWLRVNESAP